MIAAYQQVYDPIAHSLAWSSLFAAIPLITLFVLLGVVKLPAQWAALISLVVSVVIAVVVYPMPLGQAVDAGVEGAAFGLFPIMWIVVNAIWVYNMTVATGDFDVLRRSFARVSDDQRIQAIIIAFSFGALLEALAGFGTPVAITSVMLMALGFRPMKAAAVALVANTAPVAFGALAVPITTLSTVTGGGHGLTVGDLGAMVGRQTPILALLVPLALVAIVDGVRGIRQTWPAAVVCGVVFAVGQYLTSNHGPVPLTDIVASLLSAGAVVLFLRVWQPSWHYVEEPYAVEEPARVRVRRESVVTSGAGGGSEIGDGAGDIAEDSLGAGGRPDRWDSDRRAEAAGGGGASDADVVDSRGAVVRAYAPYFIIIAIFSLAQIPAVKDALDAVSRSFQWPGLDVTNATGKTLSLITFKFNWLSSAGTLLLIAGLVTMVALRMRPAMALGAYRDTLYQLRWAILTVAAVLALAFVMNASGQTVTLGRWMAGAGGFFAFLSSILGWLGVAVTGSDTSSNSLFGALQVQAAGKAGLSPTLMAAANSSGGVLGKMISPQNLAIAAAAVGLGGREGDIFRRVFVWSVVFVLFMCVLVYLQSTAVLGWMVP